MGGIYFGDTPEMVEVRERLGRLECGVASLSYSIMPTGELRDELYGAIKDSVLEMKYYFKEACKEFVNQFMEQMDERGIAVDITDEEIDAIMLKCMRG